MRKTRTVDVVLMMYLCGLTGELGKRLALLGSASVFLSQGGGGWCKDSSVG